MNNSPVYNPQQTEQKWYSYWLDKKFFKSVPDEREPYTVVIPPPNVTGVLHMGHMLNNTIQDVLVRRARMLGKNACWVPGTDHASIATEAKVVAMLKEQGIDKKQLTREEFLKYALEWKDKYGGIILKQLEKLGASCDWDRTRFTMDEDLSKAVVDTFIHFYNKGFIYRGIRMVNWDPQGKTAVSDEEVIRKEVNQKLYYIRYKVLSEDENLGDADYIVIATTRPETIMADSAICVNPNDERYKYLKGKKVRIPLLNREIPIIEDEYVDAEFGTGCLKVTPAHDLNDYQLGIKHNLEVVDILNDDGTLNDKAKILVGEDRFIARKKIAKLLTEAESLEKIEDYKSQIGFSERTDAVIEPKLSMQWFLKMEELAKPALEYVLNGEINLIPDKFTNTYRYWMENVKDWCISRQLWWGQRIPAWYYDNLVVVAATKDEAIEQVLDKGAIGLSEVEKATFRDRVSEHIRQDEDVVDTWFSSWLWPISVFDPTVCGHPEKDGNTDLNYYYPTDDLVTAPEILFFWVARMIIAGQEFRSRPPFKNVYLTGIVRDKLGRKMSKSLGNSPDPLELIEKYGADGVRVGMLLCSPAGNDLMFDEGYCEQGRNFWNKLWNAFKLVKGWQVEETISNSNTKAIEWFESRFNEALTEIEQHFNQFRLSEALMAIYKLVWDDFCSWYLEMVKPAYGSPIDTETLEETKTLFLKILKLVHPFMPFITEELYHDELFGNRLEKDCCVVSDYPVSGAFDKKILTEVEVVKQIISEVRNFRNSKQISPKEALPLAIKANSNINYTDHINVIRKLANINEIELVGDKVNNAFSFLTGRDEFFIALNGNIDAAVETERINKELEYLRGFLKSVDSKLSNERFVQNAKSEVVDNERRKKADTETKIKILEESLQNL